MKKLYKQKREISKKVKKIMNKKGMGKGKTGKKRIPKSTKTKKESKKKKKKGSGEQEEKSKMQEAKRTEGKHPLEESQIQNEIKRGRKGNEAGKESTQQNEERMKEPEARGMQK